MFSRNVILIVDYFVIVDDGKKLEKEMNDKGPGEAYYIKCDVTIEEDIKVSSSPIAELGSWCL